jgi:hypothetical protein
MTQGSVTEFQVFDDGRHVDGPLLALDRCQVEDDGELSETVK